MVTAARDAAEKSATHKLLPAGIVVQSKKPETTEIEDADCELVDEDEIQIEIDLSAIEELHVEPALLAE